VIPTALCTCVRSAFCAMYAIVTSPFEPSGPRAGIGIRIIFVLLRPRASHFGRVTTFSASKCFHLLIVFAAAGSAKMMVFPPLGGNCVRVSR
jgi:hypothetical protein